MKKGRGRILLLLTALLIAFECGMFYGRRTYNAVPLQTHPQETASPEPTASSAPKQHSSDVVIDGKINVNAADIQQLQLLPGIGQHLAGRIVDYREENGPFEEIDDLLNVNGLGESKLRAIAQYITVG